MERATILKVVVNTDHDFLCKCPGFQGYFAYKTDILTKPGNLNKTLNPKT